MAKSKKKSLSLNSRGTLSRKQETSQTDLHNKIVLALEAPPASCGPTRSTRFEENPSIKALAGGSGPGKYLIYAEDGSGACGAASTTAEDHVAIEDCSDGEACDADQVDYPALEDGFGSGSKFFLSATSNSGQSAPTSNPPCGKEISGTGVLHKEPSTLEGGLHAHSGTIKPLEHAIGKRRDLFTSNRSCADCLKLVHFSGLNAGKTCTLLDEDFDSNYDVWKSCIVGYVAGKFPGFKACNNIIANTWCCEASLTIHESGWLVYRFNNVNDKLEVLSNGPYLVYDRPLMLKPMPEYFDFAPDEMTKVPIWVKFPNLPLECWSTKCLSKIASMLGKPIQSDKLTASMSRLFFARVLIELDLLVVLPSSINILLLNGATLVQPVVYETMPKFCKFCKILGHTTEACSKASTADGLSKQGAKDDAPNVTSRRSRVHARVGQAIVNAMQVLDPMQAEAELTAGCIKTTTSIGVTNKGAKGGEAASCDDVHASFDPDAEVPAMENIGRKAAGVQSLDPMHAEAEAMAEEWEKSKRQYMPRSRGLSAGGGPRASTQNSKGKEIAGGSVATPKARVFDGSSVGVATSNETRRLSTRASGSGRKYPTTPTL